MGEKRPHPGPRRVKPLNGAGAEVLLICTNTMHKVFDQVRAAVSRR